MFFNSTIQAGIYQGYQTLKGHFVISLSVKGLLTMAAFILYYLRQKENSIGVTLHHLKMLEKQRAKKSYNKFTIFTNNLRVIFLMESYLHHLMTNLTNLTKN